jgi:UPF0716 protein FxsA
MPILALAAILALPLAEIAAFIVVGGQIGVLGTLAWVVVAMVLGAALLRDQPMRAVVETRAAVARRQPPARPLFDVLCRTIAGILLVIPGFVTDAIAILLLVPPLRGLVYGWFARAGAGRMSVVVSGLDEPPRPPGTAPKVIEGEYTQVEDPPRESAWRPPSSNPKP